MARIPRVTRTVTTTKAKILCVDVIKREQEVVDIVLCGAFKSDRDILKAARVELESDDMKVVHVVSSERAEQLYGMSEQAFVANAEAMPPRGKKSE